MIFSGAKNNILKAWRNPFALLTATIALWGAAETARLLPMDAAFSHSVSWIEFFEIPVVKFFLILAFASVEAAARAGILAPVFFLLALGVIASCVGTEAAEKRPLAVRGSLIALVLLFFTAAIFRIGSVASPLAAAGALIFPMIYWIMRIGRERSKNFYGA